MEQQRQEIDYGLFHNLPEEMVDRLRGAVFDSLNAAVSASIGEQIKMTSVREMTDLSGSFKRLASLIPHSSLYELQNGFFALVQTLPSGYGITYIISEDRLNIRSVILKGCILESGLGKAVDLCRMLPNNYRLELNTTVGYNETFPDSRRVVLSAYGNRKYHGDPETSHKAIMLHEVGHSWANMLLGDIFIKQGKEAKAKLLISSVLSLISEKLIAKRIVFQDAKRVLRREERIPSSIALHIIRIIRRLGCDLFCQMNYRAVQGLFEKDLGGYEQHFAAIQGVKISSLWYK